MPDPDTVFHWKAELAEKTCCPEEHRYPVAQNRWKGQCKYEYNTFWVKILNQSAHHLTVWKVKRFKLQFYHSLKPGSPKSHIFIKKKKKNWHKGSELSAVSVAKQWQHIRYCTYKTKVWLAFNFLMHSLKNCIYGSNLDFFLYYYFFFTWWFVLKLSTCLLNTFVQKSLQMNFIMSNSSLKLGVSRVILGRKL